MTATDIAALGYTNPASSFTGMPDFVTNITGVQVSIAMTLAPSTAGTEVAWQYRVIGGVGRAELGGTAA